MAKEFLREFRPCVLARYPSTAKRMSSGPGAASETVIIFDRFSIGRMELSAKPLILWRSLGDSNPCFRRERAKFPERFLRPTPWRFPAAARARLGTKNALETCYPATASATASGEPNVNKQRRT
jgi:hypothetical protein